MAGLISTFFGGLIWSAASLSGQTWSDINPNQSNHPNDPDAASGGRVNGLATVAGDNTTFYAATEWGGLYKTTDGGVRWNRLDGHVPTVAWDVEVDPSNANRVYATSFYDGRVATLAGINISLDAGVTWNRAPAVPPAGFCAPGPGNTDPRRDEPSAFGIAIDPATPQNVYVGTNCGLAISNNNGVTWTLVNVDPTPGSQPRDVWDVVVHNGGIIDVCGDAGHNRSTNGGTTWNPSTLPFTGTCSIAVSPDEANVLFVTVANQIFESDDGGTSANWAPLATPEPVPQGRIPFVATNGRTGNQFDLWFGDVGLWRATCTSNTGAANRCPVANPPPLPAGWAGPFTRDRLGVPPPVSARAHDDVGDLAFDSQAADNACPLIFASDGGVYRNGSTTSPACQTPTWQQPTVTPHALWLWTLAGADQAGDATEDLYLGAQDNGSFASTDVGTTNPNWNNADCCDIFHFSVEPARALYPACCFFVPPPNPPVRMNRLRLATQGLVTGALIGANSYPTDGVIPAFTPNVSDQFGNQQYVILSVDCAVGLTGGCSGVNGGDGGIYITNNVTANPINWTELGNATEPPTGAICAVKSAVEAGTPTFYVQSGICDGRNADLLWRFDGTAPGGNWQQITTTVGGFGVFDVDPTDPDRLMASNIVPGSDPRMIISTDGGTTWDPMPELDDLMTGSGVFRYQVRRGPTRFTADIGPYPQPSLVAFDPEDELILVAGGRNSGVFLSTDGGADWELITDPTDPVGSGIPHLPRPVMAYFDHEPSNEVNVYLGTVGRGVWRYNFFRPPIADADGPYVTLVGNDIVLQGSGFDPDGTPPGSLTFQWDFDGDGVFNDATGANPVFGGSFVSAPGTFPVALQITDPDGATDVSTTVVNVIRGLRYAFSLHAGIATPIGGFPPNTNTGWTVNADGILPLSQQLAVDLRLGYSGFPVSGAQPNIDIWNLTGGLKLVPVLTTPMVIVNAGLGLYWIDYNNVEFGYNVGTGLSVPVGADIDLEATFNLHSILGTTPNMDFGKVQLGLIFNF